MQQVLKTSIKSLPIKINKLSFQRGSCAGKWTARCIKLALQRGLDCRSNVSNRASSFMLQNWKQYHILSYMKSSQEAWSRSVHRDQKSPCCIEFKSEHNHFLVLFGSIETLQVHAVRGRMRKGWGVGKKQKTEEKGQGRENTDREQRSPRKVWRGDNEEM